MASRLQSPARISAFDIEPDVIAAVAAIHDRAEAAVGECLKFPFTDPSDTCHGVTASPASINSSYECVQDIVHFQFFWNDFWLEFQIWWKDTERFEQFHTIARFERSVTALPQPAVRDVRNVFLPIDEFKAVELPQTRAVRLRVNDFIPCVAGYVCL